MNRFLRHRGFALALFWALFFSKQAGAITTIISGFEGGTQWNSAWLGTPYSLSYSAAAAPSYFNPIEGGAYLTSVTYSTSSLPTLTLALAGIPDGNILSLCYGTKDGGIYAVAITITSGADKFALYPEALPATSFPFGSSLDWHMAAVSLNYLKNLGLDTSVVSEIVIDNTGTNNLFGPAIHISYDRLVVEDAASSSPPNIPTAAPVVLQNCGSTVILTMPPVVTTGSSYPVEGYHIYRAPAAGTPYTSVGYVAISSTTFTDNTVAPGSTYWYMTMPFDTVAPNSPTQGVYLTCQKDLPGQAYFSGGGGPNEELISTYASTFAVSLTANAPGTITAPTGLTGTGCAAPEVNLLWNPATIDPAGSCNYIVSYTVYFSSVINFATYDTKDVAATSWEEIPAYAGTVGLTAGNTYYYKVRANDEFGLPTGAFSDVIAVSAIGLVCDPPTAPTFTPTSTKTPVPTVAPVPGKAQIYPNPFRPDQGECFRVGAVPPNTAMKVYDMIGALVYSRVLGGTTDCVDNWDGNNNNGQKVVTGLYQVLLTFPDGTNTIYRVAVIRGN